jgi:hypothetical protein
MIMRALSLRQPWANFAAHGEKTIETRRWETPYRGWLLICATRERVPYYAGPYGVALAVARLTSIHRMTRADQPAACCKVYPRAQAWVFDPVHPLPPEARFPVRGQLGLFTVSIPQALENLIHDLISELRPTAADPIEALSPHTKGVSHAEGSHA